MIEKPKKKEREFMGKLVGPYMNKQEKNMEKKRLKAYLKGEELFSFGVNPMTRKPYLFRVDNMLLST